MEKTDRQAWIIVGAIFATMFFIWGGINCGALFLLPVLKSFGWTRAQISVSLSAGWVFGGAAGPVIGLLADRVDTKKMMIAGATAVGLLWVAMAHTSGFAQYTAYNGLFGISVGACTSIPCTMLIAQWFTEKRGLAMGIAISGMYLGGAAMARPINYIINTYDWRTGYLAEALPVFVIVIPLIVFVIRQRRQETPAHAEPVPVRLPGLDMSQAIRTRSFWLVALAWVLGGLSIGMAPHFVAYLTGIGYTSAAAATVMLLYLVATTVGALLGGRIADGLGARTAFTMTCLMSATGMFALLGAAHLAGVALNIVAGGFAAGAWAVLMPLVLIQSFGMKRFGSVMGWTGVFYTAGAAVGPILTGHIFDVSHSYAPAITMFGIMLIGCAAAIFGTASYEDKEVVVEPAPIAASA